MDHLFFFFFFLFLAFQSLQASLILVAASPFLFSRLSHLSFFFLSAKRMASSLFFSSSISLKCLLRLFNQSVNLLNSFWAISFCSVYRSISLSQELIISISCVSLVILSFLYLVYFLLFSSRNLLSLTFSVLMSDLSLSSLALCSLQSVSLICLHSLLIFSISFSLLFLTSRMRLFNLSISSFFSSACFALSCLSVNRSFSQLFLVFSREPIFICNSSMRRVCESSSSAAVASFFCMMILQLDSDSQILTASLLVVVLDFKLLSTSTSLGFFSSNLRRLLKIYSRSFLTRLYSQIFSSSTNSPSLICCSTTAQPLNSISIFASFAMRSRTSPDSSWIKALLSLTF